MAAGDFTLGIPGVTSTTFATTPIPALSFADCWTRDAGFPQRGEVGYAEVIGRSTNGIPQIAGVAYKPTYLWTVVALLTQAQARQLGALAKWQDAAYKANTDGALRLIDQMEFIDSEPSPHSRTLLTPIVETFNAAYVYGYGVFPVKLQLPQDWRSLIGRWVDTGLEARQVTFTLLEV